MTTRALELFDALCDASEEEQARTLTGESEPVRQRVEAMLRADADPGSDTPDPMLIAESMAVDLADDFTATTPCGISVPDELPGFELLGELGQGGMGVVFAARQLAPRRPVAIKFLIRPTVEADMLARLKHPSIPLIHQCGTVEDIPYLVMERVTGVPLLAWCAEHPQEQVLQVFFQICDAVEHAHAAGVQHRDLKANNILVEPGGHPWVLDFGLATLIADDHGGFPVGTLAYVADEVLAGEPATPASDVFSLAIVLCEMLGRGRPTRGSRGLVGLQRSYRKEQPPSSWSDPRDQAFTTLIRRALGPPEARPQTAAALADEVRTLFQPRPRRPWALATVTGLALVATLAFFLHDRGPAPNPAYDALASSVDAHLTRREPARAALLLEEALEDASLAADPRTNRLRTRLGRSFVDAGNPTRGLPWLERAWTHSTSAAEEREIVQSIADGLAEQRRWDLLSGLLARYPDLTPQRQRLDQAQRRFDRAPLPAPFRALARGTPLPIAPVRLFIGDRLEGTEADEEQLVLGTPTGTDLQRLPYTGLVDPTPAPGGDGRALWLDHDAGVLRTAEGDRSTPFASAGSLLSALQVDAGPLMVGIGPPEREIRLLDADSLAIRSTLALDSDPLSLEQGDFDGDGTQEVALARSAWRAFDLSVLGEHGVEHESRLRVGGEARLATVRSGGRDLLALAKLDAWPSPILFGEEHPSGAPQGVYLLTRLEDGWQVLDHHPMERHPSLVMAGDFDGDGEDSVVAHVDEATLLFPVHDDLLGEPVLLNETIPLAAADADGDSDDELYVRRMPNQEVWILGTGDVPLPPIASKSTSNGDAVARFSPQAGRRLAVGRIREAAQLLERTTPDEASGGPAWLELADAAGSELPLTRQHALERARDAGLDVEEALAATRQVLVDLEGRPSHRLDFRGALPPMQVHRPASLSRTPNGLRLRTVGSDGLLFSIPVEGAGDAVGLRMDLTIDAIEIGLQLSLALVDAEGRTVVATELSPYGGGRRIALHTECHRSEGHFGLFPPMGPHPEQGLPLSIEARRAGDRLRCLHSLSPRHPEGLTHGFRGATTFAPVALELRMHAQDGYEQQILDATLTSIEVTGVQLLDVPADAARTWVTAPSRAALDALVDHPDHVRMLGQLGAVDALRQALRDEPAAHWIPGLRFEVASWLTALADRPRELASAYATAWEQATRTSSGETTRSALAHPLVDGFPLEDPQVQALLVTRASAMLDQGEPARARTLLERVVPTLPDLDRPEAQLLLARARVETGDPDAARRACDLALADAPARSPALDPLSQDPDLWVACGRPALAPLLAPRPLVRPVPAR